MKSDVTIFFQALQRKLKSLFVSKETETRETSCFSFYTGNYLKELKWSQSRSGFKKSVDFSLNKVKSIH